MRNPRLLMAINQLERAIQEVRMAVSDERQLSLIASLIILDDDFSLDDDSSVYWSIGEPELNLLNVEALDDEIRGEKVVADLIDGINPN